jgi:hypothetical protein
VIFWKDFILDDVVGPILADVGSKDDKDYKVCRRTRLGSPSVMEDARGNTIQETGQEQRPARMAGLSSLDSSTTAQTHTDVSRGDRVDIQRHRRGKA